MNFSRKLLFSNNRLFDVFQGQLKTTQKEVDRISKEKYLSRRYILYRLNLLHEETNRSIHFVCFTV